MPFTFAHPAIVLPLGAKQSKYLDFTALVIGAMAPDFEYFIHFRTIQIVGHTLLGQFYFSLPLTLIAAYTYHYVLKKPVILNLPKPYCNRYYHLTEMRWKIDSLFRLLVFCYSALLGSFTHVLWDSFTHKAGFFVRKIGLLSEYVSIFGLTIPIYKILQHGSTLVGFIAIMIFLSAIQDKNASANNHLQLSSSSKARFWGGTILIGMGVIAFKAFQLDSMLIGSLVITAINGVFIGSVIMSLLTRIRKI